MRGFEEGGGRMNDGGWDEVGFVGRGEMAFVRFVV